MARAFSADVPNNISSELPVVGALKSIRKNWVASFKGSKQSDSRRESCSSSCESSSSDNEESSERTSFSNGVDNAILVLEALRMTMALSPEQESAISQIRSGFALTNQKQSDGPSQRQRLRTSQQPRKSSTKVPRRVSDKARSTFMKRELTQVFREVESSIDDSDVQNNTQDVLQTFGGDYLEGVVGTEWTGRSRTLRNSIGLRCSNQSADEVNSLKTKRRTLRDSLGFRFSNLSADEVSSLRTEESNEDGEGKRNYQRRNTRIDLLSIPFELTESMEKYYASEPHNDFFCPPEWNNLTRSARTELTKLLSVDNLSRWDFDVFNVERLTARRLSACSQPSAPIEGDCPLLLVGWAILCSPLAQHAMEASLGDQSDDYSSAGDEQVTTPDVPAEEDSLHAEAGFAYNFCHDLKLKPEQVCNFLREIERRYSKENDVPYHNNRHAADVTQTFHSLLQMVGRSTLAEIYDPLELFSVLLAATFHDVGHPGNNNLFHKHSRSKWALQYNDQSILENMHSAVGHNLLMGREKSQKWDIFSEWSDSDITKSRGLMIGAVLGTEQTGCSSC